MSKALDIAIREYNAAVRTRAFVISVLLVPLMLWASFFARNLAQRLSDNKPRRYVLVDDHSDPGVLDSLAKAVEPHNASAGAAQWQLERVTIGDQPQQTRYTLSQRVRHGEIAGFLELDDQGIVYYSNSPTVMDFREFAAREINQAIRRQRLAAAGLPAQKLEALLTPLPMRDGGLLTRDPASGAIIAQAPPNGVAAIVVPLMLVVLMFVVVLIGAIPMMQGVIEEKQQHIAEVLLASVRPFDLMTGKLIGMTAVSLTLIAIYGLGGLWIASRSSLDIFHFVTPSLGIWFLLFQVLAVLMFGSMYVAIGASCSDMREAQTLLLPLNLLIMLPLLLAADVIQHPSSPLSRWAAFFPTAAPLLTIARIAALPELPLWEKLVPAVITLATTVAFVWAAGRIFRVGLMAGRANFAAMIGWIVRG